ncbi:MAG: DUF4430 domain-containing protein [Oscillospiraceae bacterium]
MKSEKIALFYSGNKSNAYISSIDGLDELKNGSGSGWVYSVNDIFYNKSAGKIILKDKDVIKWMYTLNFGKDVGANGDK